MALIQVNYLSKNLMRTVPVNVILPADKLDYTTFDYAMPKGGKFKTLYLLHGVFGNYTDWVSGTRIQRWAEEKNLAVVMPSGDNSFYLNSPVTKVHYADFIGKELVNITRKMFPLSDKREDTYIAGLSMGGYGAIVNGLNHPDTFGAVVGLSSAVHLFDKNIGHLGLEYAVMGDVDEAAGTNMNPVVAFNELVRNGKPLPKLYMSCGTEDDLYPANIELRDFFVKNGADLTWDEEKGGHDWDFWDQQIKKVIDWLPLEESSQGMNSGNVQK
ncbi:MULTISPECIES: alpha/beta hydrolase [unclassified Butyrivibrio]|uniref:alpha/beta hydrolase n=1 Tax=unclassified Butyrivibrio TaxID=2639466 RepID=UPI0003B6CA5A|nr:MULTISPECIES: alpha/beta hydrolase-fold protein [unclassified Butyrivibrio]MDC7293423.1 alpha/beta hydrolase-fold protein [Butyrivibrio sp. DSM 10294]